jgi:hypothetical protein
LLPQYSPLPPMLYSSHTTSQNSVPIHLVTALPVEEVAWRQEEGGKKKAKGVGGGGGDAAAAGDEQLGS